MIRLVWLTVSVNKVSNKALYEPGVVVFIRLKKIGIPFITVAKSKMYLQGVKSTALGVKVQS